MNETSTVLLILGMHRSGTSAVAGVLARLGVRFGNDLMPAAPSNPKGFYEHNRIVLINHHLLTTLGRAWNDPRLAAYREMLQELILAEFAQIPLWGIKDPRICRLLPLWIPLLQDMGIAIRIVHVTRHPDEVALSLLARDGLDTGIAHLLYIRHYLESVQESRNLSRVTVEFSTLLTQWKREMEKLVVGFGLNHVSITRNTANVTRFLDSKLRHHQVSRAPQQGPFRNLSIQIFEGMQEILSSHLPTKIQQVSRQIDLLHQQHLLSLVRSLRSTGISHVPI
ncbi:sulfotransferase family protein [Acidithiobacillus sulfuriphilus]|uniref:Sulfotransferase family protein n=2 Tax=Acidithiobacillus sulfuriphilus TaxID=1867749 RepID=A0A3M8QTE6_9PROT|nr:hypothetical protein [Acidithiobacillus sulfuriphilus]RNF57810.1 hypothetical protein EC580_14405 [Acidithiobacillus sulfuriphilus]